MLGTQSSDVGLNVKQLFSLLSDWKKLSHYDSNLNWLKYKTNQ